MHLFVTAASGTRRMRRRIVGAEQGCTASVAAATAPRLSGGAAGSGIELRCLTPADAHHVADLLERLSPGSRYQRYLRLVRSLSPADLARFVAVSHDHRAVGAFDDGVLVGVAQYFRSAKRPEFAEIAVEVADSHHRRGVATRMVTELARHALDGGITHLTATVFTENRPVRGLMRHSGWDIEQTLDGPYIDVVVTLPRGSCASALGGSTARAEGARRVVPQPAPAMAPPDAGCPPAPAASSVWSSPESRSPVPGTA